MERDFMGLSSSQQLPGVKEELVRGNKDSGFSTKGSGNPWPYMNKLPGLPHNFMSFKAFHEDKPKRVAAADEFQRTFNHDRSHGGSFPMAAYTAQPEPHNVHYVHQHILPNSNVSLSLSNPFFKTRLAGQNLGSTNAKASGLPVQLTIFYGGSVNVYEEISPEKAQAIMFLAGTGSSMASNVNSQRPELHPPLKNGGITLSLSTNLPPNSDISIPRSVSSHTGSNNELLQAQKMAGVSVTPIPKVDTPKILNSIPQARKASLARFIEKRKERRMIAAAPYDVIKKFPDFAT